MEAITQSLFQLEGFDAQFREDVQKAHQRGVGVEAELWRQLDRDEDKVVRDRKNVMDAIAEYGPSAAIKQKLVELEERQRQLAAERHKYEELDKRKLVLPDSVADLRAAFEQHSAKLAVESPEFGDLMRLLVPEFHIYLVRLLDGGHLMPLARINLNLAGCVSDLTLVPELTELLTHVVTVDLFEAPQRERIRADAVRLAATGMQQREIAQQLPEMTFQAVVQKSLNLDRLMKEQQLSNPYVVLYEPPADYSKLRRHKHPRYFFRPVDDYERLPI
jgi:hypothetical protein